MLWRVKVSPAYQTWMEIRIWLNPVNCMYLPNPSATSRMWHKVISQRKKACFNSEFSFSLIGCHTKVKVLRQSNYFPRAVGKNGWIHAFAKVVSAKWNAWASSSIWTRVPDSISYSKRTSIHHSLTLYFIVILTLFNIHVIFVIFNVILFLYFFCFYSIFLLR